MNIIKNSYCRVLSIRPNDRYLTSLSKLKEIAISQHGESSEESEDEPASSDLFDSTRQGAHPCELVFVSTKRPFVVPQRSWWIICFHRPFEREIFSKQAQECSDIPKSIISGWYHY
jgi:vacuolar-type H+-ATPase subunit B/Vma2